RPKNADRSGPRPARSRAIARAQANQMAGRRGSGREPHGSCHREAPRAPQRGLRVSRRLRGGGNAGGLADWYAVVGLFRRPLGLPIPHTAIIPANHREIAERLGGFIETHFLAPEPVGAKLRRVDFAVAASEWLRDPERSDGLARLILRLLPQALTAAEHSGLRGFLARQLVDQIEAVKLAPLTAELMTTF